MAGKTGTAAMISAEMFHETLKQRKISGRT
jgi:hypothetical protein